MGYRSSKRRYRNSRRRTRTRAVYHNRFPAEDLTNGIAAGLAALLRAIGRMMQWMLRRVWRKPPPAVVRPISHANSSATPAALRREESAGKPDRPWPLPVRRPNSLVLGTRPGAAGEAQRRMPYRRKRLLSRGERAFWVPLFQAVRGKYRIFCKVRLQDVVGAPDDRRDEGYWFRKIRAYHVDFVLCDPETTAALLVVELDDRSHHSAKQQERDQFKADVLASAGVPLYRVPAQQAYAPDELAEAIERHIRPVR